MRIAADAPFVEVISGTFYRMRFKSASATLLHPAQSPLGRWHHNGQKALYLSETPEGTRVASRLYFKPDDPRRQIYPIRVSDARVLNLRTIEALHHYAIDAKEKHCIWHDLPVQGKPSPTWAISDAIRTLGFDGMLCPSRSRPELTHLTLFRWNEPAAPLVAHGK